MKLIRAEALAARALFVCLAVTSLTLPHSSLAAIHLGGVNQPSLSTGLVGYWPLDGSVTNWATGKTNDISGNGYAGDLSTMSTSSSPIAGKIGQAFNFDGSSNNVVIPSTVNNSITGPGITVSVWTKVRGSTFGGGIPAFVTGQFPGSGNIPFALAGNQTGGSPTTVGAGFYNGSWHVTNEIGTFPFGQWTHIVGTYDGSTIKLYINGALNNSTADGAGLPTAAQPWNIGKRWDNADYINGSIDDVRIYNRALAQGEVAQLYKLGTWNAGHSNPTAVSNGLVGYWPLDGSTINWTTNTTQDVSGNGYSATLNLISTSSAPIFGQIGQALYFGTTTAVRNWGQYLGIVGAGNACTASECSMALWARPASSTTGSKTNSWKGMGLFGDANGFYGLYQTNLNGTGDEIYAETWDGGDKNVGTSFTVGKWIHVVFVHKNGRLSLYANGTLVGSTGAGDTLGFGNPLNIGQASNSSPSFLGAIDDVRLYSRGLTADEVRQLYKSGQHIVAHSDTTVLSNGLVAYFPFDGNATNWATGQTKDISSSGYTASLAYMGTTSSPVFGEVGQAFRFNGTSNLISLPDNLLQGSVKESIAAWFRTSASGTILAYQDTTYPTQPTAWVPVVYIRNNGKLAAELYQNSATTIISPTAVNDGKWHHFVLTADTAIQYLYVDGAVVGSLSGTINTGLGMIKNQIGAGWDTGSNWPDFNNGWNPFNGTIDDVRVYYRALSPDEVRQLYNSTRTI